MSAAGAGSGGARSGLGRPDEAGQALVVGVLVLGLVLVVMLVVPGLAVGYALRAGAASAADAAALACAGRAVVSRSVDARGEVYGTVAAVDPTLGPQAGAGVWINNVRRLPLTTVAFAATPAGADCTITATVQATLPVLRLLAPGRETYRWTVSAEAKAYPVPPT